MTAETRARPRVSRAAVAWALGIALLLGLAAVLLFAPEWTIKTGGWVLLTVLLDECGGWFGYLGLALGGLPFLASELPKEFGATPMPPEWLVVTPLVGGALFALLLVKHSGALVPLLLSVAVFALPILAAREVGTKLLDATIKLPNSPEFLRYTIGAAGVGVVLALLRRLVLPAPKPDRA